MTFQEIWQNLEKLWTAMSPKSTKQVLKTEL